LEIENIYKECVPRDDLKIKQKRKIWSESISDPRIG
jgi:hypothetical protein